MFIIIIMIIAIAGKGGTGKTTIASLILKALVESKAGYVLAVDADPNATLADSIGLKIESTISSICEEMLKEKDNLPAGMSKDSFLHYKIQHSLVERENLAFLAMGRPEGPGCYCYANNLLREILKDLTEDFRFTVIDNEAGMEHISRKTARKIDILFAVSDYSPIGVRSAGRIFNLIKEMEIKVGESFLIVNRVTNNLSLLEKEIKNTGLSLAGSIPFDAEVEILNLDGKSLWCLPKETKIVQCIENLVKKIILKKT
ncbi:MAG: AAA family ATPase [Candidatus Omnitrophota bacterium]